MIDFVKAQPHIFVFNSAFGAFFLLGSGSETFLEPTNVVDNKLWFWKYSPIFCLNMPIFGGSFALFWALRGYFFALWGYFWGRGQVQIHFLNLIM